MFLCPEYPLVRSSVCSSVRPFVRPSVHLSLFLLKFLVKVVFNEAEVHLKLSTHVPYDYDLSDLNGKLEF